MWFGCREAVPGVYARDARAATRATVVSASGRAGPHAKRGGATRERSTRPAALHGVHGRD